MITDKSQFTTLIRDSMSLAITPEGYLQEMTPFGARLMHELSKTGFFLPPFAALDIATAFYTASIGSFTFRARSRLSHKRSKSFERRYHNDYQAYLQWIRGIPEVKRLSLFLARKDGESKQQLELSVLIEVLQEIAVQCPFIRVLPWADPALFAAMEWLGAPAVEVLDELREFQLLAVFGLNGCLDPDLFSPPLLKRLIKAGILVEEKNTSLVSFERTITNSRELATRLDDKEIGEQETCTFYFLQTLISSFDPETARGDVAMMGLALLSRLQGAVSEASTTDPADVESMSGADQIIHASINYDMKLADLYSFYFNQFEPSQALRQKMAELMDMSRNAIDRSNFFTEIAQQGRQGMPNPAYLAQGTERFLRRWHRGEAVFLENDPPIREQENIAVRFILLEDMGGITEAVTDASSACFPCHFSIHKLLSMLVIQDVVKYMGLVSKFDVHFDVVVLRESLSAAGMQIRTVKRRMSSLMSESSIATPFLLTHAEMLRFFLLDGDACEVAHSHFDPGFYQSFAEQVGSLSSPAVSTRFNLVLGRAGMLFDNQRDQAKSALAPGELFETDMLRYQPGFVDARIQAQMSNLIDDTTCYFCETRADRFYIVSGGQDVSGLLQVGLAEGHLSKFLGVAREFLLDAFADEALKLISGGVRA